MNKTITMNIKVDNYTSRVLGVIKEKYGLKDKGEALDRFANLFGDDFVEREVKEDVIKDVIESCKKHIEKYGFRSTTLKDIRKSIE
jgi:hypothetical protein